MGNWVASTLGIHEKCKLHSRFHLFSYISSPSYYLHDKHIYYTFFRIKEYDTNEIYVN